MKNFLSIIFVIGLTLSVSIAHGAEKIYFVQTDHLGTPDVITDDAAAVVWKANTDPFGAGTPAVANIEFNVRFPGQYFDAETGLHYNWNRYYDPGTGRYVTSDPIGLGGGMNTFGYVLGNPLNSIDLNGLQTGTIGRLLGGGSFGGGGNAVQNGGRGRDWSGGDAGDSGYPVPADNSGAGDASQSCPIEPESEGKCKSGEYGPFHRRQGHELSTIDLMQQSNQLWGTARRGSVFPEVQAWKGPIPDHKQGVEFCTSVAPSNTTHPSWVSWFAGSRGASPVPDEYDWIYIPIRITKINR